MMLVLERHSYFNVGEFVRLGDTSQCRCSLGDVLRQAGIDSVVSVKWEPSGTEEWWHIREEG